MIKAYTGIKGFTVLLFFIAAVALFLSVFLWGFTKAVELLLPLLIVGSYLLITIFLLVILPASFLKDLRPSLSVYSVLMSHALGVATWMMSFFFIVKAFGFWGIFLAFLFQFLAPLAIIGATLKGEWLIAGHLLLWISFTYLMRFYSQWLLSSNSQGRQKGDIIDVDAVEVRDDP
jgi:hypothetical protein